MSHQSSRRRNMPRIVWRLLRLPPRFLYAIGLGRIYGRFVLLLTTTGRRSGLPRITPLQYEEIDGELYIGSARGVKADWYRNIEANPRVHVRLDSRRFAAFAELVTDPVRIADFLEYRLRRHPRMVGAVMRLAGTRPTADRPQLEAYAANRALVILRPLQEGESASTGSGDRR